MDLHYLPSRKKRRKEGVENHIIVPYEFHLFRTFTHKPKDLEYGSPKSALLPQSGEFCHDCD